MKKSLVAVLALALMSSIPAEAGMFKSFKSSPSRISLSKSTYSAPTRPVVVTRTVTKPARSGVGLGTLAGAVAVAGVAGYALSHATQAQAQPVQPVGYNNQTQLVPSDPNNSIITCKQSQDGNCANMGGWGSTTPLQYAGNMGFRKLIRQSSMFQGDKPYIVMEVSR